MVRRRIRRTTRGTVQTDKIEYTCCCTTYTLCTSSTYYCCCIQTAASSSQVQYVVLYYYYLFTIVLRCVLCVRCAAVKPRPHEGGSTKRFFSLGLFILDTHTPAAHTRSTSYVHVVLLLTGRCVLDNTHHHHGHQRAVAAQSAQEAQQQQQASSVESVVTAAAAAAFLHYTAPARLSFRLY